MKKILTIFLITIIPIVLMAQKQGNKWYFAGNNAIDFNSGNPVLLTNCQISYINTEGTASISDSSGNLLFYATAENIWNKNNQLMLDGTGILGGESATQGVFIVPMPHSDSIFYIFTLDEMQNCFYNGLRYSVVNMCLDNGLGGVDALYKNILLLDTAGEKMAATFHSNGNDIWLVVHKYFSDAFYSYLITANGITDTVISHIGSYHPADSTTNCWQAIGQMKISPDGSKLALVNGNANIQSIAELFDFDNNLGIVSNAINLQPDSSLQYYGVSFSPNNTKLYITSVDVDNVYQYDLSSGIPNDIIASKTIIYHNGNGIASGLQLGPDNKIYVVANGYNYLDIIASPNNLGNACDYISHGFNLINILPLSLPNFIDNYNYKNGLPNCKYEGINEQTELFDISIFPNPTSSEFQIENSKYIIENIKIYNTLGKLVFDKSINNFSASINLSVPDGVYFVKIICKEGTIVKKIVVQK